MPEQVRQLAYYSALGQFWTVMSEMFLTLSELYDQQRITSIPEVVAHIKDGLVAAANQPITYGVELGGDRYDLLPESAGLTFLMDTAVPYVEAVFFRGTPFLGTVSYNAQVQQISPDQSRFDYGALYADPIPVGGAGVPPTLLMQDMRHFLPDYLADYYRQGLRGDEDVRVQITQSFQKIDVLRYLRRPARTAASRGNDASAPRASCESNLPGRLDGSVDGVPISHSATV